ncbi:MAG: type II/IV secretion system protein [Erysipelotrichia bacterium]|nr:type II/IV secretion system protein [Erysipelotrichia bacterium]
MAKLISATVFQRPLEQFIEEKGIFDNETFASLKKMATDTHQPFETVLIKYGGLPEERLYKLLAEAYNLPLCESKSVVPASELSDRVASLCIREKLVVVSMSDKSMVIATSQPARIKTLVSLFSALGYNVSFQLCIPGQIAEYLQPAQDEEESQPEDELGIHSLASTLKASDSDSYKESEKINDISTSFDTPSVSELVNKTLFLAVKENASDIHAESTQTGARIRFRIDGVLTDRFELDGTTAAAFFSRLMIMSHLDITEKNMPQDGSFKVTCEDRDIEFRIACMPGIFGQNIVLRLLSGSDSVRLNLEGMGMLPDELAIIKSTTRSPHGMILVAGPTGSGKSTTLYGVLESISDPRMKFITIEDPVERRIKGVQQIQVRINRNEPDRSLTFAKGLRTILRLDPDIIMVGEIRDADTAQISIQASMTGHLVLSTVHANSSAETLRRLDNIGVDFHLLMSSLNLIFAQRLMRKLCPECKQVRPVKENERKLFGNIKAEQVFTAQGCPSCAKMGYTGRSGIFEFLPINDQMRDMVAQNGLTESMKYIREQRLRSLLESALLKVAAGISDFSELERVCGPCL